MTDKKISELTSITGADVSDANDVLPIVDTSVATTKKITRAELFKSVSALTVDSLTVGGTALDPAEIVPQTSATGSAEIPTGTEAQRDGSPSAGYFRFNTDSASFEGYDGTAWGAVGGGVDLSAVDQDIIPATDNTYDLGASGFEWKDLYVDGTANIDSLVADTADINGGTIDGTVIGGSTPAAISGTTGTFSGNLTVDTNTLFVDAASDEVGIGTANPGAKLHVDNTAASHNVLNLHQLNTSYNTDVSLYNQNNTTSVTLISKRTDGNLWLYQSGANDILALTNGSERMRLDSTGSCIWKPDGTTQAMTLDASGNLLVGTTIAYGQVTSQCDGTKFTYASHNTDTTGVSQLSFRFMRNTADVGSITTTSSATAYNTSSDYRLKEDVQPMVGASDRLMALKPVNFAWKVDGSRVDGFLAHEAQEVVPEAVTGEKDGEEMQAIDHSKLVPLLTAALQEALTEIADLKARLNALEGQ